MWLARALSLQGWKVLASQPAAGSKVEMEERMVLVSLPVRPLFSLMLAMMKPLDEDQKLCRKQRICGATVPHALHEVPSAEARAAPWTRARCWFAVVKKELPLTSSQRSYPVWFLS